MTARKKTILGVCLFVIVFAALLITATFTDLQVSKILTSRALADHRYTTNDPFGAAMECIGSTPHYFLLSFAAQILFRFAYRNLKGAGKWLLILFSAGLSIGSYYIMASDTLDYIDGHLFLNVTGAGAAKGMYLNIIFAFFAVVGTFIGGMSVRSLSDETVRKLLGFSVAMIILSVIPAIFINLILKEPVGRIRFRAMNMYPDNPQYGFSAFARWYEWNGQWLDNETKRALFGTTDALKSFPSGHTASAAMTYALVMLNDALDIKSKKLRAFNWVFSVVFTGAVAVGRIVVGAHFFSDVLVGGTITFLAMIFVREIFVCKGKNVKLILGK